MRQYDDGIIQNLYRIGMKMQLHKRISNNVYEGEENKVWKTIKRNIKLKYIQEIHRVTRMEI